MHGAEVERTGFCSFVYGIITIAVNAFDHIIFVELCYRSIAVHSSLSFIKSFFAFSLVHKRGYSSKTVSGPMDALFAAGREMRQVDACTR